MANLTLVSDIKADVLQRCGELGDGTSKYDALVLDYIDRVHKEVVCGGSTFVPELAESWPWARSASPGLLVLQPAYDTGGVTLTNGSTSGLFSTAPGGSLGSFAGRFLFVNGLSEVYRVATHTAGLAAFTLDLAWQLASQAAVPMRCSKLDYTLGAGIARLVEPFRCFQPQYTSDNEGKIEGISSDQLHRRFPLYLGGLIPYMAPTHFAKMSEANNVPTVRFNMTPFAPMRVEYEYIPLPADLLLTDTTLLPREHRSVLSLGACYWLLVDKEDTRQDTYQVLTRSKLQGMILERRKEYDDTSKDFAKLNPRQDSIWRPMPRSVSGLWFP